MRIAFFLCSGASAVALAACAHAQTITNEQSNPFTNPAPPPPATCAYPVDGGCAGANQNSSFVNPGFVLPAHLTTPGNFGYAIMSGQSTTLNTHPMNWNLAGVDYPVGYDGTLSLKSPDSRDPNHSPLPANCSYSRTGGVTGNGIVVCANTGAVTVTFNGWDFGETANHDCIQVEFNGFNNPGAHVVTNNRFHAGGATCANGTTPGWFVQDLSSSGSLDVENNLFDGYFYTNGGNWDGVDDRASGTSGILTIKYNAYVNMGSRFNDATPARGEDIEFNYFQDEVLTAKQHGEIIDFGAAGNITTPGDLTYKFNTILQTSHYTAGLDVTTSFWLAETGFNWTLTGNVEIGNNTIVTNQMNNSGTWSNSTGYALFGLGYGPNIQGALNSHDNYVDPTGALFCFQNNPAAGGTGSVSGATFTVTALGGSEPFTPGLLLTNSAGLGFVNATIQPYGTAGTTCTASVTTGCTLALSGGVQTIASNSTWVAQSGFGSFTETNNIDLKNGSPITTGYSAVAPGPYNMNSGAGYACFGANSRS